jgi:hypothetical protein
MNTHTNTDIKPHLYKMVEVIADQLNQMQYDGYLPDNKAFNRVLSDLYGTAMDLHAAEEAVIARRIELAS